MAEISQIFLNDDWFTNSPRLASVVELQKKLNDHLVDLGDEKT